MKKLNVPPSMKVQLSRLFGSNSKVAKLESRSTAEWQRDLRLVLVELHRYLEANVDSDLLHLYMLQSGFASAYLGLEDENFWPAYTEGITRIALCLMAIIRTIGNERKVRRKLTITNLIVTVLSRLSEMVIKDCTPSSGPLLEFSH